MDLEQLEALALGPDRSAALAQLIPGTPNYYLYRCLLAQHAGDLAEVDETLAAWTKQHGHGPQIQQVERRQALLRFSSADPGALAYLRDALNVSLDHQPPVRAGEGQLPTALAEGLIARDTLLPRALSSHARTLRGFTGRATRWLLAQRLPAHLRRPLLERVQRPDHDTLVAHIVEDLKDPKTQGFGSLKIHGRLLAEQLETLAQQLPHLEREAPFVAARVAQLWPTDDDDWRHDRALRREYLDRLWAYVAGLAPVMNALRVHVLYHRLDLDRQEGVYDPALLLAYLRLPKSSAYVARAFLKEADNRDVVARLSEDYSGVTQLAPLGDDTELVTEYLTHVFKTAPDVSAYTRFVERPFLDRTFALSKIAHGEGDLEQWYAMLGSAAVYQGFKDEVQIAFVGSNAKHLGPNDPVEVVLDVKNVQTMVVKVFEINTVNHFVTHDADIDESIDLDGLVARQESTETYDEPPYRRVRRSFEFDALAGPGTYVVEFIGGGKSSRALVRKGSLRVVERISAAGHVLTVLNADNRPQPGSEIWFGGRAYPADAQGRAVIPFGTVPGSKRILLRHGNVSTVTTLRHRAEQYGLAAGFFIDREQLKSKAIARLVIRPGLTVHGVSVPLSLLQDPVLTITSTDRFGVTTTAEVRDLELSADAECVHAFGVPQDLALLSFQLRGTVKRPSQGDEQHLDAESSLELNGIEQTTQTEAFHLSQTPAGCVLFLLGRNGEPRPHQRVSVALTHALFTDTVDLELQTDANGRVQLGHLPEILRVSVTASGPSPRSWPMPQDGWSGAHTVHLVEGESATLPTSGTRDHVSLLECRGPAYARDRHDHLRLDATSIEITGLPPGDYSLFDAATEQSCIVRVSARSDTGGQAEHGWTTGPSRLLERRPLRPVNLTEVSLADGLLRATLTGHTPTTRVHIVGTRFVASARPESALRASRPLPRTSPITPAACSYVSGRDIGDEYRYILERKLTRKFPGTMLARPGLLLNPWAVRQTTTAEVDAVGGSAYDAMSAPAAMAPAPRAGGRVGRGQLAEGTSCSLAFLERQSIVLPNLRPKDGVIEIPVQDLAEMSNVTVVAVDNDTMVWRNVALAEGDVASEDLRLTLALDRDAHFSERRQQTVLQAAQSLVIDDITTSSVECYDTLVGAFKLLSGLLEGDAKLAKFEFVVRWPDLDDADKHAKYSECACHELNLWLQRKDPAFFDSVVAPYLESKRDKTFLDHYLLGADLSEYLDPWAFGRLNIVERILLGQATGRDSLLRHVQDKLDLLPPDRARDARLFSAALQGTALDGDDRLGLATAKAAAVSAKKAKAKRAAPKRARARSAALESVVADAFEDEEDDMDLEEVMADPAEAESFGARGGDDAFDLAARRDSAPLFRQADTTSEWAENNYYQLAFAAQTADLVTVNRFWRDFANHRAAAAPFVSAYLADASNSFTEIMLALAVTDLPFSASAPQTTFTEARMEMVADAPLLAFHQEIKPTEPATTTVPVLVSQNYLRDDDRHTYDGADQVDKYVRGEFLAHTVYVCQVVLTNPTSAAQKLELLLQIPKGAIAVGNGFVTRGRSLALGSYETESVEYGFYFPQPGQYPHFPAHVSKHEALVAAAAPTTLDVVESLTDVDTTSWAYVSEQGTHDAVLAYLREHNVDRIDLSRIAWRMQEPEPFHATIAVLRERHVFSPVLWAYGLKHDDAAAIGEYLAHQDDFVRNAGLALDTPDLVLCPVQRGWYEHLEYLPLTNARAHRLGKTAVIPNTALAAQYRQFLAQASYQPTVDAEQLLAATYYLLLQDRVEEGLQMLERVDPASVRTSLQYAYLRAYCALLLGDTETAETLARAHAKHPVDKWRKLFANVTAQIEQARGAAAQVVDDEDRQQSQTSHAAAAVSFELEVVDRRVRLSHRGLSTCQINYFPMDIELLFSRQPFVQQDSGRFAVIMPTRSDTLTLPSGTQHAFELPEAFRSTNVIVEAVADGKRKAYASYAHDLNIHLIEAYGQLRVRHSETDAALPVVYVKVFARHHDGTVKFYKDGYTDLRGYFDYATLSTGTLDHVARFALLILSETDGAVVREADPPQR